MDKIQNNATEVANESANVAVETTSVKNVNYSEMIEKRKYPSNSVKPE